MTGRIAHHAATSLIFPLPAPGSRPKRAPVPWDPAAPYKGLGFREVDAEARQKSFFHAPKTSLALDEIPLRKV